MIKDLKIEEILNTPEIVSINRRTAHSDHRHFRKIKSAENNELDFYKCLNGQCRQLKKI